MLKPINEPYEPYEVKKGAIGMLKKISVYFSCMAVRNAVFGFIKVHLLHKCCFFMVTDGFMENLGNSTSYFMNLMNVCVVRIFKRFFGNTALIFELFMKRLCSASAFRFIKFEETWA